MCFGVGLPRQIPSVRRCLSESARTTLVTCFVFSRLDYCDAMFTGLPRCDLNRFQSIQNAAVRLNGNETMCPRDTTSTSSTLAAD